MRHFEFDYDLTWYCFILDQNLGILGRYGGRDASGPDSRNSLQGLSFALEMALKTRGNGAHLPPPTGKPVRAEDYPAAKKHNGCIHCHNIKEFQRSDQLASGAFDRDALWAYPPLDNLGMVLDVDQGNRVSKVIPGSSAAAIGLAKGDVLLSLKGRPIHSFADASFVLHKHFEGPIELRWTRGTKALEGQLIPKGDWRKSNITWRPSMLDILPGVPFGGEDLTDKEKDGLDIPKNLPAFRQGDLVHAKLKAAGFQAGDVVVGIRGQRIEGKMDDFLAYIRRNYLVGDKIRFRVVREGKPVELELVLR